VSRRTPAPRRVTDRGGVLLTVFSAVFFGTLAVFGKKADGLGISVTELLAIRFGGAAVLLGALAVLRGERLWWGKRSAGLVVMGLLYVGQAATYFTSLQTVPAAVTSILLYLYPVLVMLLAAVFHEHIGPVRVAALLLAVAGVFLVADPLSVHGGIDRTGILLGLATAAVYATYILTGRALMRDVPPVVATATISVTAAAAFAIAGAVTGQLHALAPAGYALALSMSVVATAVPATLFLAGLARVGATRAAILSTFEPVVTVVLAALLLGEDLGPVRLVGGVVILAAAVTVARSVPASLASPPARE
jgi:drug/metabolite transporter (DMT)-like permease